MEYKVIICHSGEDLTKKVSELTKEGWTPIGSHQVQIRHIQNRFRGTQHIDTINDLEYSQTMMLPLEEDINEIHPMEKGRRHG